VPKLRIVTVYIVLNCAHV